VKLRNEGDVAIMERAALTGCTGKELEEINWVQIYLQVETLADICTAKGDKPAVMIEKRHHMFRTNIGFKTQLAYKTKKHQQISRGNY
jgi:hypothetical protein